MGLRSLVMVCTLAGLPTLCVAQTWLAGGSQWRPFSYSDEQQHLQGIAVDITRQVLKQAGIEADFVSYPVNRLQVMLDKGQLDMSYAESRVWLDPAIADQYVFSVPYLKVREYLYWRKGHPATGKPLDSLQNLTIGMVRGYHYPSLEAAFDSARLVRLETSQDQALLELLRSGRVDAVAMVDDLYRYLTATGEFDPQQFQRGVQLSEAPLSMMLRKQHAALLPAIDKAIVELQRSGEITRIHDRHLPRKILACVKPDNPC